MYRLVKCVDDLLLLKHVVQNGSINRAASAVRLSQPALTRRMHRLEKMLGVPLLDRTARGIVPTIYARTLLTHWEVIDLELNRAWRSLEALRTDSGSVIRLGCTPALLNQLLPATLVHFQRRKSRLRVQVIESLPAALLGMLRREELDIIVFGSLVPHEEDNVSAEVIGSDQTGLFVRASHPLTRHSALFLARFSQDYEWVFPDPASEFHRQIEAEFKRLGVRIPDTLLETPSTLAIRWLLRETDRIAVTGKAVVATEIADGSIKMLAGDWTLPNLQVVLYTRKTPATSPERARLINSFRLTAQAIL
jgi:DNA-binding transcriptional LysR family regulator